MYAKGVGCLDCHDAHSAQVKAEDNSLCTQCHSPAGNVEFPSLPLKVYDDPSHHFHDIGSKGAQCKSCHMIERTYMGTDGRRDHSFRIPRPDLSAITGAPDACTDCHSDQSPDWAASEIAKRYPEASGRPHYGTVLAAGRADPATARDSLSMLAQDRDQAGLVRATALWLLSQAADDEVAEQIAPLLEDSDPLVRAAAIRVQGGASAQTQVQRFIGLLDDPVRMVRIETAKAMLNAPIARLPKQINAQMQRAMGEWRASLQARSDYPETHMVLGGMALTMRNIPAAKGAFREVVRMDPQREEAWVMLTRITAAVDGREATLALLEEALEKLPDSVTLQNLKTSVSNP
jgi:predicted CXXCH cytochrome family protein